jgi:hypothetical protein
VNWVSEEEQRGVEVFEDGFFCCLWGKNLPTLADALEPHCGGGGHTDVLKSWLWNPRY